MLLYHLHLSFFEEALGDSSSGDFCSVISWRSPLALSRLTLRSLMKASIGAAYFWIGYFGLMGFEVTSEKKKQSVEERYIIAKCSHGVCKRMVHQKIQVLAKLWLLQCCFWSKNLFGFLPEISGHLPDWLKQGLKPYVKGCPMLGSSKTEMKLHPLNSSHAKVAQVFGTHCTYIDRLLFVWFVIGCWNLKEKFISIYW